MRDTQWFSFYQLHSPQIWLQTKVDENWITFPRKINIKPNGWIWFGFCSVQFVTRIVESSLWTELSPYEFIFILG